MSPRDAINSLKERMGHSIIGQEAVTDRLILSLLCDGNCLVEGLPGLAKTRAIKSLAKNLEAGLSRIQFTPDLLPADVTGSEMYLGENSKDRFEFQPGPIFSNLILADEINRAPAKVQSSLLEAMEERQVTVAGKTHALPELFMVMATQNPVEQEGTYPLPEAQLDRFLLHIYIDYPDDASEQKIIELVRGESAQSSNGDKPKTKPEVIPQQSVFGARAEIDGVTTSNAMARYIVDLVAGTRRPAELNSDLDRWIEVGGSPRASLALDKLSRGHAWMRGSQEVTPDDIRAVVHDALRHRLILTYEANAEGVSSDDVIEALVKVVAVV